MIKKQLTSVWRNCKTKQLAKIFEDYMKSIGAEKSKVQDDKINTYLIDGKSTNWNRIQCYYRKDSAKFWDCDLVLVLRKEAGDYFIIEKKTKRAFEVDYSGVRNYDEALLNEIMQEHKALFDILLQLAD